MDCYVESCDIFAKVKGLCPKHYTRWLRHGDPLVCKILPARAGPYESILKHGVIRRGECLIYQGPLNGPPGYGIAGGKLAHRVVAEKWLGSIPQGVWIDHVCHNLAASRGECAGGPCIHRRCVNPVHLRMVSPQENTLASPITGGKTHCKHGHEYTPENTYYQKQSRGYGIGRVCKACRRSAQIAVRML